MTTTVDPTKELGFQIALENDGPEPAYDILFKINSTVEIDLGRTLVDVDIEGKTKDSKVCDFQINSSCQYVYIIKIDIIFYYQ